jgi:RNA polymerase sigma factor (sigma-70 family)
MHAAGSGENGGVTDLVEVFQEHRGRMFGIAYRMLGTVADAEEVLQDAWIRWQKASRADVVNPGAFLAKTVTNLCLTQLTTARARRETYVGEWLPEPVLTGPELPELAEQRESVSFALLKVLEHLTPAERAAYVLREAFAYSHREVGDLIGTTEANARQLHSRARKRVATAHQKRPVDPGQWRILVERFLAAAQLGEVDRLADLLAADVVSRADGGGKVHAARNPVSGRDRVARYLIGVLERFGAGIVPALGEANGEPVIVAVDADGIRAVCFFEFDGELVTSMDLAMNPDKLALAAEQLSRIGGLSGPGW